MPNEYSISFCPLCLPFTPRSAIFQGIDQDPKRAYKAVISTASEPLCATLRPASAAETAVLDETFRAACASDLRASLARVRLYVPDACTAVVLVQHAVNRIGDAYGALRLAARQVGARVAAGENGLMDDEVLKRLLKDVCGEEVLDGAGSPPGRVSVYPSLTEHKYRLGCPGGVARSDRGRGNVATHAEFALHQARLSRTSTSIIHISTGENTEQSATS